MTPCRRSRRGCRDTLGLRKRERRHEIPAVRRAARPLLRYHWASRRAWIGLELGVPIGRRSPRSVVYSRSERCARARTRRRSRTAPHGCARRALRLHVVVLLELEVVHDRRASKCTRASGRAWNSTAPAPNDLRVAGGATPGSGSRRRDLLSQASWRARSRVDLVVEELARAHALEQKKGDVEILVACRDASPG